MSQKIIALSHIAKTAGTSLNYIFRRYFGASLMACRFREGAEQHAYSQNNLVNDLKIFGNCRCISGHCLRPWVDFGKHEKLLQRIIFVREPDKRFLSLYVHQQTEKNPKYKMSLLDWSKKYNRKDGMVRYIAGEQNLQKAIDILEEKKMYVGMQNKYTDSLLQIKKTMGMSAFNIKNIHKKMEVRDSSIMDNINNNYTKYEDCIRTNNVLDDLLYEYILKNIWPKQIALAANISESTHDQTNVNNYYQFLLKDRLIYRPWLTIESLLNRLPKS